MRDSEVSERVFRRRHTAHVEHRSGASRPFLAMRGVHLHSTLPLTVNHPVPQARNALNATSKNPTARRHRPESDEKNFSALCLSRSTSSSRCHRPTRTSLHASGVCNGGHGPHAVLSCTTVHVCRTACERAGSRLLHGNLTPVLCVRLRERGHRVYRGRRSWHFAERGAW